MQPNLEKQFPFVLEVTWPPISAVDFSYSRLMRRIITTNEGNWGHDRSPTLRESALLKQVSSSSKNLRQD